VNFIQLEGPEDKTPWGPSGRDVYDRTYSRIKDNGERETWKETVARVVDGNLRLVDGRFIQDGERNALIELMEQFAIIPAGRHLWLSGVPGKQFINNCWVSGWTDRLSDHFAFTFDQLMQGGGVGANYSKVDYGTGDGVQLHLVCDPSHPDYDAVKPYLSTEYVSDSYHAVAVGDSREAWVGTLVELIDRDQFGDTNDNPLVYDLSKIRASGTKIKTFGGTSAGPVPLAKLLSNVAEILNSTYEIGPMEAMELDHAIAECVVSGNVRRSARMSILHWKSPDIFKFINLKSDWSKHWSTNISVEVDDEFFEELAADEEEATLAYEVFNAVTEGMMKNGEPGFWNSSLSNLDEPNPVEATNPCGEITLPAWGVCNLGHVNLDWFADKPNRLLAGAHQLMARFLVRATFADIPREEARAVQDRDRRIGVGHFGYHGFVAKREVKYSESHEHEGIKNILSMLYQTVRDAARAYAYELRIPEPVKVTTVAPTGTIAKMPGRSEGIHPIFSPYFLRRIRFSTVDPDQIAKLEEYKDQGFHVEDDLYSQNTAVVTIPSKEPLVDELRELGLSPDVLLESSLELSLADQLGVQQMYQQHYADNAVSYTVNFHPEDQTLEELREVLLDLLPDLKGTTVFPVLSRPQSPYEAITKEQFQEYLVTSVSDGTDEECSTGACPVK